LNIKLFFNEKTIGNFMETKKIKYLQTIFYKTTLLIVITASLFSCGKNYVPRPYGYFRVDLPPHNYRYLDTLQLPYRFEISSYAKVEKREAEGEKCWIDIKYPFLNAAIYCSYKPIHGNLKELLEDTRQMAYKHSIRADAINEKLYQHPEKKVYGILYDLKGNTASSVQFFVTDSIHHFFRGSLYFDNVPNKDSIAPMSDYIRQDIIRLMESFEWKQ
jgi:gliding motility-associated lipoprotein GldD